MTPQTAGDVDYEACSSTYSTHRRTDPRIAAYVHDALEDARTVVNVGAGTGSYEPTDRYVIAVEPSASMRAQRPSNRPAIDAVAERLPLDDASVDAAMATITVHQWRDKAAGLREMRRVARGPVVVLAIDGPTLARFWLADYAPELITAEVGRYPGIDWIGVALGGRCTVTTTPVPLDCVDGFVGAFYGRPEQLLDPAVRAAQSAWGFIPAEAVERGVAALREALASGEWDARYGALRSQPAYDAALRLIVSRPN
jgi:SAM-dependent methyltransferase